MVHKLDLEAFQHDRARWRRSLLFPSWLLQILILLCLMGIFAYRLAETFEHYSAEKKNGAVPMVEVIWEATNVAFNLLSLLLTILELARYITSRLTPFLLLSTNLLKLTLSLAVLGLDIVAHLRKLDGHYPTIGLSLDCGLLAASLSSFLYALLQYKQSLHYEQYHLTSEGKRAESGIFMSGAAGPGRITGIKPYNRDSASYRYDYARTVESEDRRMAVPEIHVSRQQSWRTEVIAEEGEELGEGVGVMGGDQRGREGDRDGLLRR
ncbi:hypothetical protein QBC41DRAFT_333418 [Cercophora samala]|uniref:Uncharacterized protein n=1 Tax=Cercophora samala TaxID=330535 RepID=A0AA39ZM10_9PEZI|nr:hypothetical protein QBC41DRAFT_333418 [Cercophora samala]